MMETSEKTDSIAIGEVSDAQDLRRSGTAAGRSFIR
jgi:hypothetical protein